MKIKKSIGILILGLVIYLFLVWPRQVNLELKGVAFSQDDTTNAETVSIKIDGQINNPFFGGRGFTGHIYCDAISLDGEYFNLLFDSTNKSYLAILTKNGESADYGEIFSDRKMDEIVIAKGDRVLVFPAANREEAEETADKYFHEEYAHYIPDN